MGEEFQPFDGDRAFRILVESITDYAIYMIDPHGFVASWNAGAERFKGYTAQEVIGTHFSRFYLEEDRMAGLPQTALHTARTEGKFEAKGWRLRKDGSRFWAHVVIDPILNGSGGLRGYAKITRDLSEQVQSETVLKRSEDQFRALVQSVTDYAIFMLDTKGHVSSWNTGARRIKGYEPDEIIGRHFSHFYTEEDRAASLPDQALAIAESEGSFTMDGWRRRKDGSLFWASVVIDAMRDDDGNLIGFAKITRDLTERREAQLDLERTREALFQSQKIESIGQLTGGIAHDFNNLLLAALGSLELLHKHLPANRQAIRMYENAIAALERGAGLTQRLLAFARRQNLQRRPVGLKALIENIGALARPSLGVQFALEAEISPDAPYILADETQVEMALLNLILNARDAMPEGGKIRIETSRTALRPDNELALPSGEYVAIAVMDQGTGMDAETLARAAEPFFTTKGVGKGTGLGLAMVHGVSEQLGGRLILESQLGKGTTARIWLPVAEGPPAEKEAAPSARPLLQSSLRILIVEDDALILMNCAAILEELGHVALEASCGEQALEMVQADPEIDLVITDQAMPGMSGTDLLRKIMQVRPHVRSIIATGYGELPEDAPGSATVLSKPFSKETLVSAIARAASAGG